MLNTLKRQLLFRVATGYFVIAWLMIQAADILLGNFGAPAWVFRAMVVVLVAGFPVTLATVWLVDSSAARTRREAGQPGSSSGLLGLASRLAIVAAMAVLLVWLGWGKIRTGIEMVDPERPPSIAVLPFADMSADGDQQFFAHGLSEEILNLLAGVRGLKVSGRTSSFSFEGKDASIPEIGNALDVAHVLEGSVRKAGNQVRVTAQLIATEDGFHVWSENYDRELTGIFAIQDEIAGAIASRLRLSLIDADGQTVNPNSTSSMPAYEMFLEARQLIQGRSVQGIQRARELLGNALELDPEFAPAQAQLALAWLMLSDSRTTPGDEPFPAAVARARQFLDQAMANDPDLASAYAVQGLLLTLQREFERAEESLARALTLNPSHSDALNWRAMNLRTAGQLRDEIEVRRQLEEIDPLHLSNLFNLSLAYLVRGQTQQALEAARRLKREFPDSPWGDLAEVEALLGAGELAQAQRLARDQLADGNSMLVSSASGVNMGLGLFDEAIEVAGSDFAMALAGKGQFDEAIALARESAAASPSDGSAAQVLLRVLSLAGRHKDVLKFFDKRWGSLDALQAYFDFEDMTEEVLPIAAAQSALGRDEALRRTLAHWSERLKGPREQGYAMPYFQFVESGFEALSGNRARALELIESSIEGGFITPLMDREPAFRTLRGDPAFQRLVERNYELINAEREKLQLPAMDRK